MMKLSAFLILLAISASAAEWSPPAEVRHDDKLVMTYQARNGMETIVIVRAAIQPGWHTFVMDNKQRQQEKLAGKPSLGIEKSTEISIEDGLTVSGPWLQSKPKDLSKPEIRWYTWGFEGDAIFAAKARRKGSAPALVEVRGQACAADICKNIDVSLAVPTAATKAAPDVDVKSLVPVRLP